MGWFIQTRPPNPTRKAKSTRTELCAKAQPAFIKASQAVLPPTSEGHRTLCAAQPVSLSSPFRRTKGQFRALRTQNCLLHGRGICPPGARPSGQTFFYLFRQAGAGTFSGARLFCVCPFARRQNARQRVFRAPVRRNAAVPKEDTPGDVFRHGQKRFGVENFHRKRVDFYRDAPYN